MTSLFIEMRSIEKCFIKKGVNLHMRKKKIEQHYMYTVYIV